MVVEPGQNERNRIIGRPNMRMCAIALVASIILIATDSFLQGYIRSNYTFERNNELPQIMPLTLQLCDSLLADAAERGESPCLVRNLLNGNLLTMYGHEIVTGRTILWPS